MSNSPSLMAGQGDGGPSDFNLQHDISGMQDSQHESSSDFFLPLPHDETLDQNRQFSSSTAGYTILDAAGVQRGNGASFHSNLDSFEQYADGGLVGDTLSPQAVLSAGDAWPTISQDLPFNFSFSVDLGDDGGAALRAVPEADRSWDLVSLSAEALRNSFAWSPGNLSPRLPVPLAIEPVGPVPHSYSFWNSDSPDVYTAAPAASPAPHLEFAVVPFGNGAVANDPALFRSITELLELEFLGADDFGLPVRRYEYIDGNIPWNPFGIPNFGFVSSYNILFWRQFLQARRVRFLVYTDTLVLQLDDDAIFHFDLRWAGPAPEGRLP
jgi:hypothetical protein